MGTGPLGEVSGAPVVRFAVRLSAGAAGLLAALRVPEQHFGGNAA